MKITTSKERLTLSTPRTLVLPTMNLKDPDSLQTVSPPPSLNANPRLAWTYSQGTNRPVDLQHCQSNLLETSIWSVSLSVRLIDHPTTIALPEIAVRDYLFGEPHLFFKWPYLSLKKWDTWGQWERECFCFLWVLKLSVCMVVELVIEAQFLSLRTLGICRLVLLAGGVSVMSRLLCLKMLPLQCQCHLSLFLLVDTQDCSICSHDSCSF